MFLHIWFVFALYFIMLAAVMRPSVYVAMAAASAAAGIVGALGAGYWWQLATAVAGSTLAALLMLPAVRRRNREADTVRFIDEVVDRPGTVEVPIPGPEALGVVRVGSTSWVARADQPLECGTNVVVCDLHDGVVRVKPDPSMLMITTDW